jgi:hypothetical protein
MYSRRDAEQPVWYLQSPCVLLIFQEKSHSIIMKTPEKLRSVLAQPQYLDKYDTMYDFDRIYLLSWRTRMGWLGLGRVHCGLVG